MHEFENDCHYNGYPAWRRDNYAAQAQLVENVVGSEIVQLREASSVSLFTFIPS